MVTENREPKIGPVYSLQLGFILRHHILHSKIKQPKNSKIRIMECTLSPGVSSIIIGSRLLVAYGLHTTLHYFSVGYIM